MSVGTLWRRYLRWRQRHVARIELTDDGFWIAGTNGGTALAWRDVERVTAFKRDAYVTDVLCLLVLGDRTIVEVDEDMPGYAAFEDALGDALRVPADWKLRVLFPAFEPNASEIYNRETGGTQAAQLG